MVKPMRHDELARQRICRLATWSAAGWVAVVTAGCTKPHATTRAPDPTPVPATVPAAVTVAAGASPPATAPSTRQSLARLTIRVSGLRNQNGKLVFGVFTSADGFPNVEGKS